MEVRRLIPESISRRRTADGRCLREPICSQVRVINQASIRKTIWMSRRFKI